LRLVRLNCEGSRVQTSPYPFPFFNIEKHRYTSTLHPPIKFRTLRLYVSHTHLRLSYTYIIQLDTVLEDQVTELKV